MTTTETHSLFIEGLTEEQRKALEEYCDKRLIDIETCDDWAEINKVSLNTLNELYNVLKTL